MKTENQSIGSFNELVFENRNKTYGAYALRKSYNQNMSKSMLLTILFFGILTLIAIIFSNKQLPKVIIENTQNVDSLIYTHIELIPDKPKVIETTKPKDLVKPKTDVLTGTVVNKKVETTISPNDNETKQVKGGDVKGKDSVMATLPNPTPPLPPDEGTKAPLIIVDEMPEFNGNVFQYITDNIKYPRVAVEVGTQGTVYVSFVVEKDGEVGEIKILKGVSDGCTEEALRVVKSMPKWKPGKNHGMPVRVQYNLPIKFTLR